MTAAAASPDRDRHRIAVGICTHNRPAGLALLLTGVDRLRLAQVCDEQVALVIVDNGDTGSAAAVCDAYRVDGRFPLTYVREPRKGLAFARNAVLAAARELSATHLAWIDDDEVPDPAWLDALYSGLTKARSAAAIGPVYPMFEVPPPDWLPPNAFVTRRVAQDGWVTDAYTGNCILALQSKAVAGLSFNERYNHIGGEDTLFFKRLLGAGGAIAWVEAAIAHESVPRDRMRASWLWRRWFRTGALEADLSLYDPASARGKLVNLAMGLARVAFGGARVMAGSVRSVLGRRDAFVASCYTMCRGFGLIAAVFERELDRRSLPT